MGKKAYQYIKRRKKMSKNYDDYKPINPGPPRKRKNNVLAFVQYAIILLLIFSLLFSGGYFIISHVNEKNAPVDDIPPLDTEFTQPPENLDTDDTEQTTEPEIEDTTIPDEPTTPPENVIDINSYKKIELPKTDINKGNLILVGANSKVVYPTNQDLVVLGAKKTKSYQVSLYEMKIHKNILDPLNLMLDDFAKATEKKDIIVQTGYRDEKRQTAVYNDYVKKHGEEAAKTAVSKPGESDHNTGLGVVLKVYRAKEKKTYELFNLEGYNWITENCYKYGFVERYPKSKVDKTGIDYSNTTYLRYVGVPLAELMKKNDICLEEFLIVMKGYPFGSVHYNYETENGDKYEMYYVSGEVEGDVVSVNVPLEKEYTISGNNTDGFIVIVKK